MSLLQFYSIFMNNYDTIFKVEDAISKLIAYYFEVSKASLEVHDLHYEYIIRITANDENVSSPISLFLELDKVKLIKLATGGEKILNLIQKIYYKHKDEINKLIEKFDKEKYSKEDVIGIRKLFANPLELQKYFIVTYSKPKGIRKSIILELATYTVKNRTTYDHELIFSEIIEIKFYSRLEEEGFTLVLDKNRVTFGETWREATTISYQIKDSEIIARVKGEDVLGIGNYLIELLKDGFNIDSLYWDKLNEELNTDFRSPLFRIYNLASLYCYYVLLIKEFINEIMKKPEEYKEFLFALHK